MTITVRVVDTEHGGTDFDFPRVPCVGEVIMIDTSRGLEPDILLVTKVGFKIVHFDRPALPVIECEPYVSYAPPPGEYDRLIAGQ